MSGARENTDRTRRTLARRALNRRLSQMIGYFLLGFLGLANLTASIGADVDRPRRFGLFALGLAFVALILWRARIDVSRLRRIARRRRGSGLS